MVSPEQSIDLGQVGASPDCGGCERIGERVKSRNEAARVVSELLGREWPPAPIDRIVRGSDIIEHGAEVALAGLETADAAYLTLFKACHDGGTEVLIQGKYVTECGAPEAVTEGK